MSLTPVGTSYLETNTTIAPDVQAPKTVCCWYFCTDIGVSPQSLINGVNPSLSVAYQLGIRDGLATLWSWGAVVLVSQAALANQWVFISYTYDGTQHRLMQNMGVAATSSNAPQSGSATAIQTLGNTWNEMLEGKLADARIYDRVLSDAELQTLMTLQGRDGIVYGLRYRIAGFAGIEELTGQTAVPTGIVPILAQDRFVVTR